MLILLEYKSKLWEIPRVINEKKKKTFIICFIGQDINLCISGVWN